MANEDNGRHRSDYQRYFVLSAEVTVVGREAGSPLVWVVYPSPDVFAHSTSVTLNCT